MLDHLTHTLELTFTAGDCQMSDLDGISRRIPRQADHAQQQIIVIEPVQNVMLIVAIADFMRLENVIII